MFYTYLPFVTHACPARTTSRSAVCNVIFFWIVWWLHLAAIILTDKKKKKTFSTYFILTHSRQKHLVKYTVAAAYFTETPRCYDTSHVFTKKYASLPNCVSPPVLEMESTIQLNSLEIQWKVRESNQGSLKSKERTPISTGIEPQTTEPRCWWQRNVLQYYVLSYSPHVYGAPSCTVACAMNHWRAVSRTHSMEMKANRNRQHFIQHKKKRSCAPCCCIDRKCNGNISLNRYMCGQWALSHFCSIMGSTVEVTCWISENHTACYIQRKSWPFLCTTAILRRHSDRQ